MGPTGGAGSLASPGPLRSVRELALFCRGLLRVQCVITLLPQSTCPSYRSGGNWVCFARSGPRGAGMGLGHPGPRGRLALFDAIASRVGSTCGPTGQRLFRPVRGKLGLFDARGPGDGSAGAFAGPRPALSTSANWLCLYHRSQRRLRQGPRPSPSAPVDVADWLCFARRRTTETPRTPRMKLSSCLSTSPRSPRGSLCLCGRSSTSTCAGALTTKPSQVVVSYQRSSVVLLCYHTDA